MLVLVAKILEVERQVLKLVDIFKVDKIVLIILHEVQVDQVSIKGWLLVEIEI